MLKLAGYNGRKSRGTSEMVVGDWRASRFASLRSKVAAASYPFSVARATIAPSARPGSGSGPDFQHSFRWTVIDDLDAGEGDERADRRCEAVAAQVVELC